MDSDDASPLSHARNVPSPAGALLNSRLSWFVIALILSGALFYLQIWFLSESLYWRHVWLDVPMHFLGGLLSGIFLIALLVRFRWRLYIIFVATIFVGWELFESMVGMPKEANFFFDTSLDLFMDTLGAIIAYALARFTLWRPSA